MLSIDLHENLDDVRYKMILSITEVVDKIIEVAKESTVTSFGVVSEQDNKKAGAVENEKESEKSQIVLPDGTVANVTMPSV